MIVLGLMISELRILITASTLQTMHARAAKRAVYR